MDRRALGRAGLGLVSDQARKEAIALEESEQKGSEQASEQVSEEQEVSSETARQEPRPPTEPPGLPLPLGEGQGEGVLLGGTKTPEGQGGGGHLTRASAASRPAGATRPTDRGPGTGETPALHAERGAQDPTQSSVHIPQSSPDTEVERLREDVEEARTRMLASHRRALLAENSGRIVPELVMGSTVEEMDGSVEVARRAFDAARAATLAEVASAPVPAGNPVRQGAVVEGMSPIEKIAYGLKRE